MPSDRLPTQLPDNPDAPTPVSRAISACLVALCVVAVFAFTLISGRALGLPEKMTITIIALGVISGLVHAFGVVPAHRQLRAFASPVVAWPVMAAGMFTLFTS